MNSNLSTTVGVGPRTRHHRFVHEGGFGVEADGRGNFFFHRPNGNVMPESGTSPRKRDDRVAALMEENRRFGLDIDATTGACNWGGEAMDYDVAIHAMIEADGGYDVRWSDSHFIDQDSPY